jgi:hypothetical protein
VAFLQIRHAVTAHCSALPSHPAAKLGGRRPPKALRSRSKRVSAVGGLHRQLGLLVVGVRIWRCSRGTAKRHEID